MEGFYRVEVKSGQASVKIRPVGQVTVSPALVASCRRGNSPRLHPSRFSHSRPAGPRVIHDLRHAGLPDYDRHESGNGVAFTGPGGRNSAVLVQPADLRGRGGNKE